MRQVTGLHITRIVGKCGCGQILVTQLQAVDIDRYKEEIYSKNVNASDMILRLLIPTL